MNREDVNWQGYWPAAPTPYKQDGELDTSALQELVRFYIAQGVHGILINGTTGEWFSQSEEERRIVAEASIEAAAGQVPIVIGCTTYTPSETIRLAQHAKQAGADGVLATPPPYAHPDGREIEAFYREITQAVDLPWMIYNWPRGTAVDISLDLAARLVKLPRVVAYKDSTGDEIKSMKGVELLQEEVRVFGRFIHPRGMAFKLGVGGDGNIDGGGLGAKFGSAFYDALAASDLEAARAASAAYANVVSQLVNDDYSARWASPTSQLKAAMRLLDQPGGFVRPPLLEIEETHIEALRSALVHAELM